MTRGKSVKATFPLDQQSSFAPQRRENFCGAFPADLSAPAVSASKPSDRPGRRSMEKTQDCALRLVTIYLLTVYCFIFRRVGSDFNPSLNVIERQTSVDPCIQVRSHSPMDNLHNAEALESFFKTVCRLCWLLATAKPAVPPGNRQERGMENLWTSDKRHFRVLWKVFEKRRENVMFSFSCWQTRCCDSLPSHDDFLSKKPCTFRQHKHV